MGKQLVFMTPTSDKSKKQLVDEVKSAMDKFKKNRDQNKHDRRKQLLRGKHGLVIYFEDDEMLGKMYTIKLERAGLSVLWEKHPTEKIISSLGEIRPDLIIMDIIMPVMDGWEASLKLRADKNTKGIPIFGLSNLGRDEDREMGKELMDEYWVRAEHTPQEVAEKVTLLIKERNLS